MTLPLVPLNHSFHAYTVATLDAIVLLLMLDFATQDGEFVQFSDNKLSKLFEIEISPWHDTTLVTFKPSMEVYIPGNSKNSEHKS